MKEGRKKAVKLFESENEAEAACKADGDKHHLVFRPDPKIPIFGKTIYLPLL